MVVSERCSKNYNPQANSLRSNQFRQRIFAKLKHEDTNVCLMPLEWFTFDPTKIVEKDEANRKEYEADYKILSDMVPKWYKINE